MGLFFNSISFRRPQDRPWEDIRGQLIHLLLRFGISVTDIHLDENRDAYGFCTDEPGRMILDPELLTELSAITGDYVVGVSCVDSDFILVVLLYNGQVIDSGSIGENYFAPELGEESVPPTAEKWLPLLIDSQQKDKLLACLRGEGYVFMENAAWDLTQLTGLPIIDEDALFGNDF